MFVFISTTIHHKLYFPHKVRKGRHYKSMIPKNFNIDLSKARITKKLCSGFGQSLFSFLINQQEEIN